MARRLLWLCPLLLTASVLHPAYANTILFNNGTPNQASADDLSSNLTAEDFTLSTPATLTNFEFWDVEDNTGYNGSLQWFIYNTAGTTPGATILAQGTASTAGQITRTSTGLTCCPSFNEFDDVINMATSVTSGSLSLAGGTYWLALHDGPISNTTPQNFAWETTGTGDATFGQAMEIDIPGQPWLSTLQEHAFNISGNAAVPEPAPWTLIAAGLTAITLLRRKKH